MWAFDEQNAPFQVCNLLTFGKRCGIMVVEQPLGTRSRPWSMGLVRSG